MFITDMNHRLFVLDAYKPNFMLADEMKPEDVGLTPEMLYFGTQLARRTPKITYLHLYESDKFSVCRLL